MANSYYKFIATRKCVLKEKSASTGLVCNTIIGVVASIWDTNTTETGRPRIQ